MVFSIQEKLKIDALLDKTGIPELEIGMPALSDPEAEDARIICMNGFNFKSLGWCRAKKHDIDMAYKTKCD